MIDVLLATYNGALYLRELLDSLFAQSYDEFRILVRDDGSTDKTKGILEEYKERYPQRITLVLGESPAGSARDNFFRLLELSNAEYIMFCDQDDVWLEDKISHTFQAMQTAKMQHGKTPLLVHTDLAVADRALHVMNGSLFRMQRLESHYNTLNRLVAQNNISGCTVMINHELKELVRWGDQALMHDWWLGLIAAAFGHIIFLPEATVLYRQHDENEVGAKDVMSTDYIRSKLRDREGVKKTIADTYVQADSFLKAYEDLLSAEQKKMLHEYINLHYYNIGKRFKSMLRHHFFKSGIMRKLGQIVFG